MFGGPGLSAVDPALGLAVALAVAFAFTNGIHDASNAIAALMATRAARPLQAVLTAPVMARRELYRRCLRMAEANVDVAERVPYAVVKES